MHLAHRGLFNSIPINSHNRLPLVLLAMVLAIVGCSDNNSADIPIDESTDSASSARYRLTFNATWSVDSHPLDFPGASAHFSPLAGAVHNEQIRFWESGQPATPGIQQIAETGNRATFSDEVQIAINAGSATELINGSGISVSPANTSVEFTVTRLYPEISIVSMLAPSPDWFVGVHNYSLLVNGLFVDTATVSLPLYDSGTDDGTRYQSANAPASAAAPIMLLTSDPSDTPFINGEPAIGSFVFERLE